MRCSQNIGFVAGKNEWIRDNCKHHQSETCDHCNRPLPGEKTGPICHRWNVEKECDDYCSPNIFPDPPLLEYETHDGRKVREVVQASPWSSGPMFFLCLEYVDTKERLFEWDEEDLDQC